MQHWAPGATNTVLHHSKMSEYRQAAASFWLSFLGGEKGSVEMTRKPEESDKIKWKPIFLYMIYINES